MQLSQGIAGLLAVGLVISLVNSANKSDRIADLEEALEEAEREAERAGRETTRTVYAEGLGSDAPDEYAGPDDKPPLDDIVDIAAELAAEDPSTILSLPEVEEAMEEHLSEQLTQKRKAWQNRHLESNRERLADYAEDLELDEETTAELDALMEETMIDIATLRQERHAGSVVDEEAFEELGAMRRDFREELIEVLGEEEADRLQGRLSGPLSRGYFDDGGRNTPSEDP